MVSLECASCGTTFQRPHYQFIGKMFFCDMACYNAHRKRSNGYASGVNAEGHPICPPGGRVVPHRLILFGQIGPGPHPCHWCARPVDWSAASFVHRDDLVVDHIDGDRLNNITENLVPACHKCNTTRMRTDLVPAENRGTPRRNGKGYRHVASKQCRICDAPFMGAIDDKRPNRGITCSRSCARRLPREPR